MMSINITKSKRFIIHETIQRVRITIIRFAIISLYSLDVEIDQASKSLSHVEENAANFIHAKTPPPPPPPSPPPSPPSLGEFPDAIKCVSRLEIDGSANLTRQKGKSAALNVLFNDAPLEHRNKNLILPPSDPLAPRYHQSWRRTAGERAR